MASETWINAQIRAVDQANNKAASEAARRLADELRGVQERRDWAENALLEAEGRVVPS